MVCTCVCFLISFGRWIFKWTLYGEYIITHIIDGHHLWRCTTAFAYCSLSPLPVTPETTNCNTITEHRRTENPSWHIFPIAYHFICGISCFGCDFNINDTLLRAQTHFYMLPYWWLIPDWCHFWVQMRRESEESIVSIKTSPLRKENYTVTEAGTNSLLCTVNRGVLLLLPFCW